MEREKGRKIRQRDRDREKHFLSIWKNYENVSI